MSVEAMCDQLVDVVRDVNYEDGAPDSSGDVVPEWTRVASGMPAAFWPLKRRVIDLGAGEQAAGDVGGILVGYVGAKMGDVVIVIGGSHETEKFRIVGPPAKPTDRSGAGAHHLELLLVTEERDVTVTVS